MAFVLDRASILFALSVFGAVIGLLFAFLSAASVLKRDSGSEAMRKVSAAIKEGAVAYLNRQYRTIAVITVILAILIAVVLKSYAMAVTFVLGALLSSVTGYVGMMVSVRANVRTAQAATKGLKEAFSVAFTGGAVTGFAVAGLGLLGVTVLYLIFRDPNILIGFGFGASLI